MAGVEHLELRSHAELSDASRHRAQDPRRVHEHVVAARGEVQRATVKCADLRQQILDVCEPLGCAGEVGASGVEREGRFLAAEHQVAAHPGRQVDHDVGVRGPDPLHHVAVELRVAGAHTRLRIPHVDVNDRRSGLGRLDRGGRDPVGRYGYAIAPYRGVADPGDSASDEDLPVHRVHDNLTQWTM